MPTQKTFCIDPNNGDSTGYDALYTSFAAYVTAQEADLVSADENHVLKVRVGDSGQLDLTGTGWVTDATRNIVIELENSDDQFSASDVADVAFALSGDNACGIDAVGYAMKLGALNVKVSGLLLQSSGASNLGVLIDDNSPAVIENCLLEQVGGDSSYVLHGFETGIGFSGYIRNCLSVISDTVFDIGDCFHISGASGECLIGCTGICLTDSEDVDIFYVGDGAEIVNCLGATDKENPVCFDGFTGGVELTACGATDASIGNNFEDSEIHSCIESLAYDSLFYGYAGVLAEDSPVRKQGLKPATSGCNTDAFGSSRLKYDIGYYQTLLVNGKDIETVFKDLGALISVKSDYRNIVNTLIEMHDNTLAAQINAGTQRLSVLTSLLNDNGTNKSQAGNWQDTVVRRTEEYITTYVKDLVISTGRSAEEILDELDYWLGQANESLQAVSLESTVNYNIADATDIACVVGSLGQELKPQKITVECVSANIDGSESWMVTGSENGSFGVQATTGEEYDNEGLKFTISVNGTAYPSVGDKVYIYVNSSGGVFQSYFRDNLNFVFKNAVSDDTETILDSWAA